MLSYETGSKLDILCGALSEEIEEIKGILYEHKDELEAHDSIYKSIYDFLRIAQGDIKAAHDTINEYTCTF